VRRSDVINDTPGGGLVKREAKAARGRNEDIGVVRGTGGGVGAVRGAASDSEVPTIEEG
jgi:hypothetical protein